MIVITCLDQKNGMMFNHRRQSQDSVLREHVAKLVANVPLWTKASLIPRAFRT